MSSAPDSLAVRWLKRLSAAVLAYPRLCFWPQIALFVVCVVYTVHSLKFDASRNDLVGSDKQYHHDFLAFKDEFPAQDDLVVVVESEDMERNRQFVERLGHRLEAETNLFTDVLYKGDLKMLGSKALLFIKDESKLVELHTTLVNTLPFVQQFTRATNLVSLFDLINTQFRTAKQETNAQNDALVKAVPALARIVSQATDSLRRSGNPPSPGLTALFNGGGDAEREMYITFNISLLLRDEEVTDPATLVERLRSPTEPLSALLMDRFPPALQGAIRAQTAGRPVPEPLRRKLVGEINRQLKGPSFYEANRFAGYALSEDVRELLAGTPTAESVVELNRRLLETVFAPAAIRRFTDAWIYLVTARAATEAQNGDAVERLRVLVRETQSEVPGLNVGLTGEPVLEYDEMQQSQFDSTVASIVSLIACAFIFIYGYKETGRPIKATFCLIIGLGYTMGFTTLAVGHLNILTITFVPILIGLAIDFGVHLITRYEEELRQGRSETEALGKAMVNTGQGIFTGAFTTAGAFFAMAGTDFKGIQEMGIICGGGMLVCLIPMMTMLPVLLRRGRQNAIDHQPHAVVDHRARLERLWLDRPWLVVGLTAALCLVAAVRWNRVFFDYDLRNMQSAGLPAVVFEKKLIKSASKSVLFGAVVANSLAEAAALEARITNLTTVASVDSMSQFLSNDDTDTASAASAQSKRLALVHQIKTEVAGLNFAAPDAAPVKLAELNQTLWSLQGYLGLAADATKTEEPALNQQLVALRDTIEQLRRQMHAADQAKAAAKLAAFQVALFDDLRGTFETIKGQDDSSGLRAQDLPAPLRNRFIGISGKYLLQVYPKEDVWERDQQEAFVKDLRTVAPHVTGTPVQLLEYTKLLKDSYQQAALYALLAIVLLVLLHFHSISSVLLALLPVAIGSLWMVGFMGWFSVPFNPANIMTLPLVIGIGVTNGIHILNRFAEEQNPGILAKSTGKAVLVSGLTTVAGFGSLIFAKHQGISSLGSVMAVGVATCMIAGLTFLPAVLTLLIKSGWQIKKPSGDNARSTLGREEPR